MSQLLTGLSIGNNNKGVINNGRSLGVVKVNDVLTATSSVSNITTASGIRQPTISAKNTSVVSTFASSLYIDYSPVAGTNQTITNSYALYVNAGLAYLGGNYTSVYGLGITNSGNILPQNATLYSAPALTSLSGSNNYYYIYLDKPTTTGSTAGVASTLYIANAPKNTNTLIPLQGNTANRYALNIASGNSYFGGNLNIAGKLCISPLFCVNQESYGQGSKLETINYTNVSYIKTSEVSAQIDNVPFTGNQTYTFGRSRPQMWVSCGAGTNTLAYSTDGIKWTGLGTSVFYNRGFKVAWNGFMWVAVGDPTGASGSGNNSIAYSFNGINWTGLGLTYLALGRDVLWDGAKWIAVGKAAAANMSDSAVVYSYDGITWISTTSSGIFSLNTGICVAYNGYIYLAGGQRGTVNNAMAYSYDGINWTGLTDSNSPLAPNFTTTCYGIAWNGYIWVAVGSGTNVIAWCNNANPTDYKNWTRITTGTTGTFSGNGYCICWTGILWIAGGDSDNALSYSYNGNNWKNFGTSILSSGVGITWDGTKAIAHGTGGSYRAAWSRDGINWVALNSPFSADGRSCAVNTRRMHSITFSRNLIVGGGGTGGYTLFYTLDGTTWSYSSTGYLIFTSKCTCIVWNGSIWLAGGDNSTLALSRDGVKWTQLNTNLMATFWGLAWNGNIWVAVGFSTINTIIYSYDGFIWIPCANSPFSVGYNVAWNGSIWVAVGSGSCKIVYSYDGITWSDGKNASNGLGSTTIFASAGYAVAWNGFMWVVTGGNTTGNMIVYSYDGINWNNSVNGSTIFANGYGKSIAWNGYLWVAAGYNGGTGSNTTAYSSDGINWTGTTSFGTGGVGNCIRWAGNIWIAVGQGSTTRAYSYNGVNWVNGSGSAFTNSGNALAWSAGKGSVYIQHPMIALGSGTNTLAYSTNGLQWLSLGTTIFSTAGYCAAWNGTIWVAGGAGTNSLAWSQDGINWIGLDNYVLSEVRGILWNGSIWIATGYGPSTTIAWSTDGKLWTGVSSANGGKLLSKGRSIGWNGTKLVIVGEGTTNLVISSTDGGMTWSGNGTASFSTGIYAIVWVGIQWVVGGIGSGTQMIKYSSDLSTWTTPSTTTIFTTANYGLAWNGITLVAVGSGTNTIAWSTDSGASWTGNTNALLATSGQSVIWNGRAFIAGGYGTNTLAYSGDGVVWTAVPNSTNLFTTICNGVAGNSRIGATVVDSQLVLDSNDIGQTSNLDVVSDTYYDRAVSNFSIALKYGL